MNPHEIAAVNAVIGALKDAEPGTELKLPDGSFARVDEAAPGVRGVAVEPPDGMGWRLRVFEPSETQSPVYPELIPFIPHSKVALTQGADGHIMTTWETPDTEAVFAQVVVQSTESGWEPNDDNPALARMPFPMRMRQFSRGTRTRMIMLLNTPGASMVCLFDT